ncbi:hypothetical protein SPRG_11042 [Saprolegnia parasitica CBS 223.65]|uniref:Uncharacterized protein n=1 Tax=Saprolegnia parasitica (strain CBS 223.65) TaxID=695850 RepID=A0A067BSH9_SAPPC|nr:hypothetical protein SPRG_11042 [Saprolegnia parasitica CBS 223.65]KDO21183.1 hypothetical protein SPRG_11042 [Saprolegnia parasitica CBS 223.65]|eukprot:XP_012208093.1 hypothetical protein SPRG_11042 [Saprolegnia parasitica CBS 223.65]
MSHATRVQPFAVGPSLPASCALPRRVVLNKRSLCTSLLLVLNLAVMPLKAYVSESFPWHDRSDVWDYAANCSRSYDLCHAGWARYFEARQPAFGVAFGEDYDVIQENVTIPPGVRNVSEAPLAHLTYAAFQTPAQRAYVLAVLANRAPLANFTFLNTGRLLGVPTSYSVAWGEKTTNVSCIWVGFHTPTYSTAWLFAKFFSRLFLALYIVHCVWTHYYREYAVLYCNLTQFGLPTTHARAFELVLGDPTSIILLNPWIATAFVLDFWLSTEYVSRAFLRISQTDNALIFVIACFYLSRTVWFAYGALSLTSRVLKRLGKEDAFAEVDPSMTAMGVALVAGPFTCLQFRLLLFIDLYHYLFTCLLTAEQQARGLEISLAAFVYTMLLGQLPLLWGFGLASWRRAKPKHAFASTSFNDWKHRFCIGLAMARGTDVVCGGSIYALFARHKGCKKNVCISQRGADCFVLYEDDDGRRTSARLSLLRCVDLRRVVAVTPVHDVAVGTVLANNEGHQGVRITVGANNCMWLL